MLLVVATLVIAIFVLVLVAADLNWLHHPASLPTGAARSSGLAKPNPASSFAQTDEPVGHPLAVSAIIPARNEAANIGECLRGLVAQPFALPYEIIVVDDGSSDDTPQILADYAARYPGLLRVIRGRPLPAGWVGKCNACQHGAEIARGEWLLFLDADTVAGPDLLSAMFTVAAQDQLDALSVMPFNQLVTWAERIVLPIFWRFAFTVFPGMRGYRPDMKPKHAMAIGQCFMFRTRVYRALGGHAAVADKVLEDVEFAQVLRMAGYRLGLYTGFDAIKVRMYHNLDEISRGLMKHARAGQRLSGWRGYWGLFSSFALTVLPLLLLSANLIQWRVANFDGVFGIGVLAALACYVATLWLWADIYTRLFRLSGWHAVLTPLGMLSYMSIAGLGIFSVMFGRGVSWKGRVYEAGAGAQSADGVSLNGDKAREATGKLAGVDQATGDPSTTAEVSR